MIVAADSPQMSPFAGIALSQKELLTLRLKVTPPEWVGDPPIAGSGSCRIQRSGPLPQLGVLQQQHTVWDQLRPPLRQCRNPTPPSERPCLPQPLYGVLQNPSQ